MVAVKPIPIQVSMPMLLPTRMEIMAIIMDKRQYRCEPRKITVAERVVTTAVKGMAIITEAAMTMADGIMVMEKTTPTTVEITTGPRITNQRRSSEGWAPFFLSDVLILR